MEVSPIATAIFLPDGPIIAVNRALCGFFGLDADSIMKRTWQDFTPAQQFETNLKVLGDMHAGRFESYRHEQPIIDGAGRELWGDVSLCCVRDKHGQMEYLFTQVIDITDRIATENRLATELEDASAYVASVLPADLTGRVEATSRFLPSLTLGGDCFDFRWIDDDHLSVYLLDVSGHGIQATLVAMSVLNALRSNYLPDEVLLDPSRVMALLNRDFRMDRHGGNYLTMWYGIYEASTRTLRYSSAGHPPALLFTEGRTTQLRTPSLPVGVLDDESFITATVSAPADSELLLYSDGAFEHTLPDGETWSSPAFVEACETLARSSDWSLDSLLAVLLTLTGEERFSDDCSLVKLRFR